MINSNDIINKQNALADSTQKEETEIIHIDSTQTEETKINITLIPKSNEGFKNEELFKNIILIQLFRDKQKGNYVNSASNETLSSLLSPGEYIIIYNIDYKTSNIKLE